MPDPALAGSTQAKQLQPCLLAVNLDLIEQCLSFLHNPADLHRSASASGQHAVLPKSSATGRACLSELELMTLLLTAARIAGQLRSAGSGAPAPPAPMAGAPSSHACMSPQLQRQHPLSLACSGCHTTLESAVGCAIELACLMRRFWQLMLQRLQSPEALPAAPPFSQWNTGQFNAAWKQPEVILLDAQNSHPFYSAGMLFAAVHFQAPDG